MLAFVVPVKPRAVTADWNRLTALLDRTLRSICAQDCAGFVVLVACHDVPPVTFVHPAIRFLVVDEPAAGSVTGERDKAMKIKHAQRHAADQQCTHIMVVDADDCVSPRLAATVAAAPDAPGWQLTSGYVWKEGSKIAFRNTRNFHHTCGSTAIARVDLFDHMFVEGPHYTFEEPRLPAGIALAPLGFPGAIYSILNGENIFLDRQRIQSHKRSEGGPRYFVRKAKRYRPVLVTPRMRRHFGLYDLP